MVDDDGTVILSLRKIMAAAGRSLFATSGELALSIAAQEKPDPAPADASGLIRVADSSLYQAKPSGRNYSVAPTPSEARKDQSAASLAMPAST